MRIDKPHSVQIKPPKPGGPPTLPRSRQEALARVQQSSGWSELFDAANITLGMDRSAWGDELAPCCAAFALWRSAAFVVAAQPLIEMDVDSEGRALLANGCDLARASFACARELATHLLAPMHAPSATTQIFGAAKPGSTDHATGLDSPCKNLQSPKVDTVSEPFGLACVLAKKAIEAQLKELRSTSWPSQQARRGMPTPKGQAINLLVGTSCWIHIDKPNQLLESSLLSSWEALAESAHREFPAHPGASRLTRAQAESAWRDALASGPFTYLACGPNGGAAQAGSEAQNLAQATKSFSQAMEEMGLNTVGLGGLGAYCNARPVGAFATAAFENYRFDLVFKAPFHPSSLHHEWTHALDQMTMAHAESFPGAAMALEKLLDELEHGPADEVYIQEKQSVAQAEFAAATITLKECSKLWSDALAGDDLPPDANAAPLLLAKALASTHPSSPSCFSTAAELWNPSAIDMSSKPAFDASLVAKTNKALTQARRARRVSQSLAQSRACAR